MQNQEHDNYSGNHDSTQENNGVLSMSWRQVDTSMTVELQQEIVDPLRQELRYLEGYVPMDVLMESGLSEKTLDTQMEALTSAYDQLHEQLLPKPPIDSPDDQPIQLVILLDDDNSPIDGQEIGIMFLRHPDISEKAYQKGLHFLIYYARMNLNDMRQPDLPPYPYYVPQSSGNAS